MRSNRLLGLPLALAAACAAAYAWAGDGDKQFKSGLQPGDLTSAFQCRDITGPNKGKSLCYV